MNPLRDVRWIERDEAASRWLEEEASLTLFPLASGLEAEATGIEAGGEKFVLKVWNRDSKPDVRAQFKLLEAMAERGLAVSKPLGWGMDAKGNQALWTRFDGAPLRKLDRAKLHRLARMITDVHRISPGTFEEGLARSFPFIDYFFPGIDAHPDLRERLTGLSADAELRPVCLIHGDYHLGNIVEDGDRLTIIDWTNGQMGDPRYDIAWSVVLMRIYAGERNGSVYRNAFLAGSPYSSEELERFEAIACLRLLLLDRAAHLPKSRDTLGRVRKLLRENAHLDEGLL